MECNERSKFGWSFTGYLTEEQSKKALADMERWFDITFSPASEWSVITSLSQTPHGYRAALNAERVSGVVVTDVEAENG